MPESLQNTKWSKKVLFRQQVNPEDVYLGLSDIDPSSSKCQSLLLKVKLPGTHLREIQTDIEGSKFWLQTPSYNLLYYVPYEFDKNNVNAKWVKDKEELHVDIKIMG